MSRIFKQSFKETKRFLFRIRNENEAVRKRWLLIFSIPTVIIVIIGWAAYMNVIGRSDEEKLARASEPSAVEVFGTGLKVVGERAMRGGERVGDLLGNTAGLSHSFTIDVVLEAPNFIVDDLEALPKTNLP